MTIQPADIACPAGMSWPEAFALVGGAFAFVALFIGAILACK